MLSDVWGTASSLYDGGWRASDRDQLRDEYDFTEDELDEVCGRLQEYEDEENGKEEE